MDGLLDGFAKPREPVLIAQPVKGATVQLIGVLGLQTPALFTDDPAVVVFTKVSIELVPVLQATVSVSVNLAFGF